MKQKEPETRYRFAKDYVFGGITIKKGVGIKPPYIIQDECLSLPNSTSVFIKIPMEYFEEYKLENFKKVVKKPGKKSV